MKSSKFTDFFFFFLIPVWTIVSYPHLYWNETWLILTHVNAMRISAAVILLLLTYTSVLCVAAGRTRYLLYSVNPGEGFNLRRDVHVRVANLVRKLREKEDWILVLPPWPHLYHWKSRFDQNNLPWGIFFDVSRLSEYVPSIDFVTFDKYLQREGYIDEVHTCDNT